MTQPRAPTMPRLQIDGLHAGYGRSDVLHGIDLQLGVGESLCLIGPNGAGKSTVLNAVFGLADIHAGTISIDGLPLQRRLGAAERLGRAGIAYVLQDSSIFPDLSVEQNLRLGGYLMRDAAQLRQSVEAILDRYPKLAQRRFEPAAALSGGERRLLEIARALMMKPRLLLIDEPSIGLEPRAVTQVFETLHGLQRDGLAILLVEQNVRQGLAFADRGCLLVDGQVVKIGSGAELRADPAIGRIFLGAAA
ncbi:ABC transporter ATP-binding protein [Piscinibacter sakaiensis]|uniref:ABC transporter ATP-binding protein n=1 Tax=Piscinibacter sakaiensis TaxID=1547922 RepID=UPI003AAE10B1